MGKVNGMGGFWVTPGAGGNVVVHNAEYVVDTENELHETRSVGCQNWAEGLPVVSRVAAAVLRVAEDDTAYPQALGFTEGTELTVWLRRGALNEYDVILAAVVRSVRVVNNAQKARRVEIVCAFGSYARNVTPPGLP